MQLEDGGFLIPAARYDALKKVRSTFRVHDLYCMAKLLVMCCESPICACDATVKASNNAHPK